jgi:PRC-barrel domain
MAQRITPRATKTTSSSRRLPQKSPDSSRYGGGISSNVIGLEVYNEDKKNIGTIKDIA